MTRKLMLIAGVAGLALTVPATAERGGRGDEQRQNAAAQQAEARKGGGQQVQRQERQVQRQERQVQRQERVQVQRAERPQRVERAQRIERQQVRRVERAQRVERPQRIERQVQRVERPQRVERQQQRIERQVQRAERPQVQRIERQQQRIERQAQRPERRELIRAERQQQRAERGTAEQVFARRTDDRSTVRSARFDGRGYRPAAPFLASRDMRPMKRFESRFDDDRRVVSIGERIDGNFQLASVPVIYGTRYIDTPDYYHRYDSDLGYIYRIDRDDGIVRSLIPLFGGYGYGDPWPTTYYSSYVPLGYQSYYYDTPDYYYRNDGFGIYQVDAGTQLITALVALITGQGFGIGQQLPLSYGAYNVPLDYRANYYDTDDQLVSLWRRLHLPGRSDEPADRGALPALCRRFLCRGAVAGGLSGL